MARIPGLGQDGSWEVGLRRAFALFPLRFEEALIVHRTGAPEVGRLSYLPHAGTQDKRREEEKGGPRGLRATVRSWLCRCRAVERHTLTLTRSRCRSTPLPRVWVILSPKQFALSVAPLRTTLAPGHHHTELVTYNHTLVHRHRRTIAATRKKKKKKTR